MLDVNHPESEFIFNASHFIDSIKDFCRIYILQDFSERKETFKKMKSACTDLKVFSEKHFKENSVTINEVINELIAEFSRFEEINIVTEKGNCKLCNSKLNTFDTHVKEVGMLTICEKCPSKIYDYTNQLEWLTGAAFI